VNLTLVDVVYEWARGVSFADITRMTLVQEGSIVKCITRLDELFREVRNAARIIGNPALYRKMEQASESVKRDVIFAASLYI
jgi:antiviral helicase SKI2